VLLLALSFVYFRKAPQPEERSVRFQVPLPEKWSEAIFRLSPEGRYLAIGGKPRTKGLAVGPAAGRVGSAALAGNGRSEPSVLVSRQRLHCLLRSGEADENLTGGWASSNHL
jgi:hypothetical protein